MSVTLRTLVLPLWLWRLGYRNSSHLDLDGTSFLVQNTLVFFCSGLFVFVV